MTAPLSPRDIAQRYHSFISGNKTRRHLALKSHYFEVNESNLRHFGSIQGHPG